MALENDLNQNDLTQQVIHEITSQLGRNEGFPHQQLLNEADAALILQVKPSTLQNWRCTGRYDLPFVKTGRLVRYRVADIAAWIAKRRQLG